MTKTERRNYQFAMLCSIMVHVIVVLFYLPEYLFHQDVALKIFPVGIVELLPGSGGSGMEPQAETKVLEKNPPKPIDKTNNKPKKTKPAKQLSPDMPKTNPRDQTVSELNIKPPKPTLAPNFPPSDNNGSQTAPAANGNINSGNTEPPSGLGNGEGKVFRLGALPLYPKNALNEGIEGEVSLRILVFQDGSLERIDLLNSSGDSRLDKASLKAVNSWQFKPESKNYYIDILFGFSIKDGVMVRFINAATRL